MNANYTTGMELTAIPRNGKIYRVTKNRDFTVESRNLMLAHSTLIQYQLKQRKWKMGKKLEGTIDGHCVEIKSPPFDSKASAISFFNDFVDIAESYGYKPQHPSMVCGGNHIHFCFFPHRNDYLYNFEIEKNFKQREKWILGQRTKIQKAFAVLQKLEMECLGHYYIPWVFLHPDDTESGNNDFLTDEGFIIRQLKGEIREHIEEADNNRKRRKELEGNCDDDNCKGYKKYKNEIRAATNGDEYLPNDEFFRFMVPDPNGRYFRYIRPSGGGFRPIFYDMAADKENWFTINCSWEKPPTFEFRCFEMPETQQQFKHQYEFAEALVKYVLKFPKKYYPTVEFMGRSVLNGVSFEHCRDKFNALLVKIGLDPADYAIYVERNMKPRFAKGYVRR